MTLLHISCEAQHIFTQRVMAGESPPDPTFDPKEEKQMMDFLTQQVQMLKEKARLQASVREEKKLLVENSKLKKDIDELKRKLQETQRRKAMKLHQERVLTASVTAIKTALSEVPAPPEPMSASKPQRSNTHIHSEGRRRRDRRGIREEVGGASKGTAKTVCGLERDPRPDISRLDLRIGRVLAVRKHPDSESLYVQEVDVGDSAPRTVVSELANHMPPEQLQDTLAILLCNVRPVKVRGVQSQARVLCAINQHRMEPLTPPTGAQPGDRVTFQTYPAERELNPKRRVWECLLPDLRIDERGVATYRDVAFEVRGKGLCRAPTISNGGIK
ncbi:aminoacyl tRNA synthase complex-interacting multifunctional protein 1 isoform X2 [Neoarius graeffei]|uniref:aminoacyl tRNA synthase complex-interacting multifunctional protein 1 isoform X2 n=1 Tax=Neoarius graeffei TaxID=443677 RepID=UPI00298BCAA0|nr:aminoacyl tRNA synthase complex-interacting multifunctional protein 1 isoform X2 [Neoarius graeffei]